MIDRQLTIHESLANGLRIVSKRTANRRLTDRESSIMKNWNLNVY